MTAVPGRALPLPVARYAVLRAVYTLARPTVRSVALNAGLSPSVAAHHLRILRHQGFVAWEPHRQGTLRPTHTAHAPCHHPGTGAVHSTDTTPPEGTTTP